ncbi:hypothetical protein JHK85_044447 [Glycine max]|nr:hypothetical protein JHK86_043779 [Glycine max]KAG4958067.1 hypothetical protein JHK85_044447 [Glycine max]
MGGKHKRVQRFASIFGQFMRLNVDGSSLRNPSPLGYRGFIRNSLGEWITGFSGFCGIATNLYVELFAILQGLKIAWESSCHDIICESNSTLALSKLTQGNVLFHPYVVVINQVKSYMSCAWNLKFIHILKEGNNYANELVKM